MSATTAALGTIAFEPTVVWLEGEQDFATLPGVASVLADAMGANTAGVVVDLSAVTYMDASTIGVLIGARNLLRAQSRTLTVRSPSTWAGWLLTLCGLTALIDRG